MAGDPETQRSDFLTYHRSLAGELHSVKNRVRNLIRHWATDGAFKEAALRSVLRRHLPETFQIGTGFIVNGKGAFSSQIDLLIVDRNQPTLFKDGDLLIVTPSAVRAIIEVKTTLSGPKDFTEAIDKLASCKEICRGHPYGSKLFLGLFVYEGKCDQANNLMKAVKRLYTTHRGWIDSVVYGPNLLGFHAQCFYLPNKKEIKDAWCFWDVPDLAPSYFLSSIVGKFSEHESFFSASAWFPHQQSNTPLCYMEAKSLKICKYHPGDNTQSET